VLAATSLPLHQLFEERLQETAGKNDGRTGASGSSNSGALLGDAVPLLPLGNPELGDAILKKIRTTMCKPLSAV
jgi:hypothetical protein